MSGATPASLRERYDSLLAALEDSAGRLGTDESLSIERDRLKGEIIKLFREADASVREAQAFKESIRGLAGLWKHLRAQVTDDDESRVASSSAGGASQAQTVSTVVDHLGASTFTEKGWSRLSLGDPAGAEVALHRALDLAPGNSEAEALLGWAQMLQGRYDTAQVTLSRVIAREPAHALAWTNLGYIALRKHQYEDAVGRFSAVIQRDTDRKATLWAHLYLGMAYRERGLFEQAEQTFRTALELGPNLLQAWYELGRTYWFSGRRSEALRAWETGASSNRFNPWGKRCAELLLIVEAGGAPQHED